MAEVSFRNALAVEAIHYDLYQKAATAVTGGADLAEPLHLRVRDLRQHRLRPCAGEVPGVVASPVAASP